MRYPYAILLLITLVGAGFMVLDWTGVTRRGPEEIKPDRMHETLPSARANPQDWPWWRGPDMDGKGRNERGPLEWSTTQNVLWRTPLFGRGHSSPIVCRDRVFLTTADDKSKTQYLLAFDRSTGKELFRKPIHEGNFSPMHEKNSQASSTPACDGQLIYLVFLNKNALHVTATTLDGMVVWQREAGAFRSEHGYGASPILHESYVIVVGDNPGGGFMAALHRKTGEIAWRVRRGAEGSYSSPIILRVAAKWQLLLSGNGYVGGYDPLTGDLVWRCKGPAPTTANTMAADNDMVFASGGYPEKRVLAIRANGSGDVSDTHVQWKSERAGEVAYVPSLLTHNGLLFVVNDAGVVTCFDAVEGTKHWQKRMEGNYTASPILVGEHIYLTSEAGRTYIFLAENKHELVAKNDLDETTYATPVMCGNCLFIRTFDHLYCINDPAIAPPISTTKESDKPAPATAGAAKEGDTSKANDEKSATTPTITPEKSLPVPPKTPAKPTTP